jgi:hypothetical protein
MGSSKDSVNCQFQPATGWRTMGEAIRPVNCARDRIFEKPAGKRQIVFPIEKQMMLPCDYLLNCPYIAAFRSLQCNDIPPQEVDMFFTRSVFVSVVLATLLFGCKKTDVPPKPTLGSSGSVAIPAASLPKSDAAIPAATPSTATNNGDANGPSQANPKELSKQQESSDMPLSGQANNHSTANPVGEKK